MLRKSKLLLVLLGVVYTGSCLAVTIVNFPLTSNNQPSGYSIGNGTCRLLASTTTGGPLSYDINKGISTTGWNSVGQYWYTTAINASEFYSLSLTVQMNSEISGTNYGPRDFMLQYSINGGSTWVDIQQLPRLTTTLTSMGTINLPAACNYVSDLRVRFRTTSTNNVNGGTTIKSAAKSLMKGLVISGEELTPPTTQSSNISVVAMTPTTISIDCSVGTGMRRLIYINTVNSFVDPTNDFTPSYVSSVYATTTQQCIYDGPGSAVMVQVPSAQNVYYFRVYDYNIGINKKRYQTKEDVDNPKYCKLENIILPTLTDIRLTTAVGGGTITSPPSGTITERGVYWSTTPGVSVFSQKVLEGGADVGTFTCLMNNLPRSTAQIYMKAFVTNLSGTSLSEEISFSNIPVFTGSGNWENPSLWNVLQVPGEANAPIGSIEDSPVISGQCALNTKTSVLDLTINAAKDLTISPAASLTIDGKIYNNAGTSGLLIKSSSSQANGSIIFNYPGDNQTVPASVEMYSKASTANSQNHWQYFGIPVTSARVGDTFTEPGDRVRKYHEENVDPTGKNNGLWRPYGTSSSKMGADEILVPVAGYEVVQPSPKTYTFAGNLNIGDITHEVAYTAGADWAGQNILSNPFTAAINISQLDYGTAEQAVYIYNTGSLVEWTAKGGSSTPGSAPGTYSVSTAGFAGIFGTPAQIPSMQGFLINTTSPTTLGIPYSSAIPNTVRQRTKAISEPLHVATMIDVIGTNSSDRMWIFSEPTCTRRFDNGFDGRKILASALNTQIFAMEEDDYYQIDAIGDINDTYLGFKPGADTSYKLVVSHLNLDSKYSKLYLVDLVANKMVDITADGTTYDFTAESSTSVTQRFKITTATGLTTDAKSDITSQVKFISSKGNVNMLNCTDKDGQAELYNPSGLLIRSTQLNANASSNFSDLMPGVYIVKIKYGNERYSKRLIIQ
ncbi:MAG TPA: T9SS type A sorting domain-containing protein [Paludibacter sp.]|nr:T9SS type A sorting domain-containing protein [Paludibacter sp.]